MMLTRCYTRHGNRAHLMDLAQPHTVGQRLKTFCGHDAYALSDRSRFFRRRLAKAPTCFECVCPEVVK